MSKKINLAFALFASLLFLTDCQNRMIPQGYLPNPRQVGKSITGSWIKISTGADSVSGYNIEVYGELIAVQNDTLYVLTDVTLLTLHEKRINSAVLFIFTNPGTNILMTGGFSYIPNILGALVNSEYAGGFLMIGVPLIVTSLVLGLPEKAGNSSLQYPEKCQLTDFKKFARFPAGLPPGLDRNRLHLIMR